MGQKPSAIRSRRSSARPSGRRFSFPSGKQSTSDPPETRLPPVSADCNNPPATYPSHPSPSSPPVSSAQSVSPDLQLSTEQNRLFVQPAQLVQPPFLPHSYSPHDPTTTIPDSGPTIDYSAHSPSNVQPPHAAPPFITPYKSSDSTYQSCSIARQLPCVPQGAELTVLAPRAYQSQGMFSGSQNLSFSDTTFIDNSTTSDNFMEKFLQHTIIGAEFDSSDRYPPPRCHPGTRLAIVERCKIFIVECSGKEKMRWVVGSAGVGKSAIMQMVAEQAPADASVFFAVNGRRDGTKLFTTIAYQLAAKCEPYRQYIRGELTRDPSLFRKALPVQFQKFITEPFVNRHIFNPSSRSLIIIDGLDECDSPLIQRELLVLISEFCLVYPNSPIVWFIASRPEPHITSFFDNIKVAPAYTKEEIIVDSDEACEDVQRYLRDELNKIKDAYPTLKHKRDWPSETEFTKIATAAGGLFAYASTVVRYVGDPHYRDPVALLRLVLDAIDAIPKDLSGREHPMAQLDALYERILSNIPADVMSNTRKLLLIYSNSDWKEENFRAHCNRLELTEDAAYGAISHLHAVVKAPAPHKADDEPLRYFHKSFTDFLFDFKRSRFCRSVADEAKQLQAQVSLRIVEQVPDEFDSEATGGGVECYGGYLKNDPGFCDNISLSWPGDERFKITDSQLRLYLYKTSMGDICRNFSSLGFYANMSNFRLLTTRFTVPDARFPWHNLLQFLWNNLLAELTELGEVKQVPLRLLDYAAICGTIEQWLVTPVGQDGISFDSWNQDCEHRSYERKSDDHSPQRSRVKLLAPFERYLSRPGDNVAQTDIPRFSMTAGKKFHWEAVDQGGSYECLDCSRRFARHFIDYPDQLATVFVDSTEMCYVELSFIDPDDGVSKWRYRFFHSGPPLCNS